jgi:hypothetical protein
LLKKVVDLNEKLAHNCSCKVDRDRRQRHQTGDTEMELLRTDRTYKTYENAYKALVTACQKMGRDVEVVRWVIAANSAGRFAPMVVGSTDQNGVSNNHFMFVGITWIG